MPGNFVVGNHVDLEERAHVVFRVHLHEGMGQVPVVDVKVFQYVPAT